MRQKYKSREEDSINIHPSLKLSLKILRIFGFFPLSGLSGPDYKSLKFLWFSFEFLYSLFYFVILCLFFVTITHRVFTLDGSVEETTNVIFYLSATATNVLFLQLTKNWPYLMQEWSSLEKTMGTIGITQNLKRRLKFLIIIFFVAATVEHILIQCHLAISIFGKYNDFAEDLKHFYTSIYYQIFSIIEYSPWKALLVQVVTIRSTFSWTFIDVFIMLISTAFAFRLKQLNAKVEMLLQAKVKNPGLWRQLRYEHYRLYKLGILLNSKISYIVIVSYGTNLYFIVIQLFGSMKVMKSTLRKVYYFLSFAFLITRLVCVCLFGASVNDENRKILPLLFSVPSSVYNIEIERFIDQIIKNTIVLSAKNFFRITKGLVLQIAAAVITYEIVLIQFNLRLEESDSEDHYSDNSSTVSGG